MKAVGELFEELRVLVGTWKGEGRGQFPTIDAFRYLEETAFCENAGEMLARSNRDRGCSTMVARSLSRFIGRADFSSRLTTGR